MKRRPHERTHHVGVVVYRTHQSLQQILASHPAYRDYSPVYYRRADALDDLPGCQDVVVDRSITEYEWDTYAKSYVVHLIGRTGAQVCHVS